MKLRNCLLASLFVSPIVWAKASPELTRYFEQTLLALDTPMQQAHSAQMEIQSTQAEEDWFLKTFMLRIRAKAGFSVGGVAKLEIIPEAELIWQRESPEGWKNYTP